jgi:rod shape-determining protein MreD
MTWRIRFPLVLLLVLVVQKSVLEDIHVHDVRPDALLLLAVCAGLVGGSEVGAVVGFAAGLLADMFVLAPLGLSAMVFALVGFAVGALQAGLIRAAWWIPPVTALIACGMGVLLYGVLGAVVGQTQFVRPHLLMTAVLVAVMDAVLAIPLVRITGWAIGPRTERVYPR